MLFNQIDDPLQDQILLWHRKPDCEGLCNEALDIAVNCISMSRPDMMIEGSLGILWRIARGHPKDAVHDDREIYNVAHHATDILLAIRRDRSTYNMRYGSGSYPPLYTSSPHSAYSPPAPVGPELLGSRG